MLRLVQAWLDAGVLTAGLPGAASPDDQPLNEKAARWIKEGMDLTLGLSIDADAPAERTDSEFLQSAYAAAGQRKLNQAEDDFYRRKMVRRMLANIYLSPFDRELVKRKFGLVRFADDWVVCCPGQQEAEQAYNSAIAVLAKLRLKINPEKTHIRQPSEPVEWLGMTIRPELERGV